MVLSLSAKGLTHGEISAHLAEVYGADVSKTTISTITDKVMDGMTEWQNRPLDRVYPVVFIDAINVKIRTAFIICCSSPPAPSWPIPESCASAIRESIACGDKTPASPRAAASRLSPVAFPMP